MTGDGRWLLPVVAGALLTAACARNGLAPVVDRSTSAAPVAGSDARRANADAEVTSDDWTATVRPLGDSGASTGRSLSDNSAAPAPKPLPAPEPSPAPAPAVASNAPSASPGPSSGQSPAPGVGQSAAPARGAASSGAANPAVVSLLNTASVQSQSGDYTRAAATLERAIAIEPNNAWLWHRLAETRVREGRLDQAVGLAAKSNALATADRSLQAENWKLIAEVRRRQGDAGGAASAEARAASLSN
jgi:tetratricopeptide (TPR) repeat protein